MIRSIFIILFYYSFCIQPLFAQAITQVHFQYHAVTAAQKDSTVQQWLQPYTDSLNHYLNSVIGFSLENVYKKKGGGPLGNFITAAMLQQALLQTATKIDAAFLHPAGIKGFLPQGNITIGTLYALLPYTNRLVVQQISGAILEEFVHRMAADGGWLSTGINYAIDVYGKAKNIRIQQQPILPNAVYHIVVSDYMANGGSNCSMLRSLPSIPLHTTLIETCKNYIQSFTNNHEPITVNKAAQFTNIYE
ncbi:5'-nucleotidase C-terminal domain-containing protein [Hydrotalea sp.]|nr:5'-nucleotidase [Hydrotalea sp.]